MFVMVNVRQLMVGVRQPMVGVYQLMVGVRQLCVYCIISDLLMIINSFGSYGS